MVQKKIPLINAAHGSDTRNIINEIIKAINDRGLEILSESSFLNWLDENGVKHQGEWDDTKEYDGLSVVLHEGTSYTSKKNVPVGIDVSDEEFWVVTGNYNVQVETYRRDVERMNEKQIDFDIKNSGFINVKSFGVVGDGEVDDTENMIQAINEARNKKLSLYSSRDLNIKITDTVDMSGIENLDIQSVIISHVDNKPAIIIGDDSRTTPGHKHYINTVRKGNTKNPNDIAIRLQGLKNVNIEVRQAYYIQLYANNNNPSTSSIAYSTFDLGATDKLELYGETSMSWINENTFYGRFIDIIIGNEGSYVHNNNVFYKPSLENGSLKIITGSRNNFYDVRTEGDTFIEFGENSRKNLFIENYSSSPSRISPTVIIEDDKGYDNVVTTSLEQSLQTVEMVSISNERLHDGFSLYNFEDQSSVIKNDSGFSVPFSFRRIFNENIKTDGVKRLIFDAETINDENMFRVWVYCLDENQNQINADGRISAAGMEFNSSENRYQVNSNVNNASILVLSDDVKYLSIVIMTGNNVDTLICNHFSLYTLTNKNDVSKALIEREKFYRDDYSIIKDSEGNKYRIIMGDNGIETMPIN